MATTTTAYAYLRTCSSCAGTIDTTVAVVDMGAYGLAFHPVCFTRISGAELLHLIREDETVVRQPNGIVLRARDARNITANGTVNGAPEIVNW